MEDRELNQARSKPDTVDQPIRTARIFMHHYNSTQYCSTEAVFLQFSPSSRPTSHLRCGQVEVRGRDFSAATRLKCCCETLLRFVQVETTRLQENSFRLASALSSSTRWEWCRSKTRSGRQESSPATATVRFSVFIVARQQTDARY